MHLPQNTNILYKVGLHQMKTYPSFSIHEPKIWVQNKWNWYGKEACSINWKTYFFYKLSFWSILTFILFVPLHTPFTSIFVSNFLSKFVGLCIVLCQSVPIRSCTDEGIKWIYFYTFFNAMKHLCIPPCTQRFMCA